MTEKLYQDVILDHYKNPRNCYAIAEPDACISGNNPLCGDSIKIYIRNSQQTGLQVSFEGKGCAISQASASIVSVALNSQQGAKEGLALLQELKRYLVGENRELVSGIPEEFLALGGVKRFPARIKCATLAIDAYIDGLQSMTRP